MAKAVYAGANSTAASQIRGGNDRYPEMFSKSLNVGRWPYPPHKQHHAPRDQHTQRKCRPRTERPCGRLSLRPAAHPLGSECMGNHYVQVLHGVANVSPYGFMVWARHFRKCRYDFKSPDRVSPLPHFLICRAIELGLKARHLETLKKSELKIRFGHDLIKSLNALPKGTIKLTTQQRRVLATANQIYDKPKGFEYWSLEHALTGLKKFPELSVLDAIADIVITD